MKGGRLQLYVLLWGSGGWREGGIIIRTCLWVGYSVHRRYCVHSQVTYTLFNVFLLCLSLRTFLRTLSPYALITAEGGKGLNVLQNIV